MKNILFTILLTLTLCSCGSRKMNKSKTEEIKTVETSAKTETNKKSEVILQNDIVQETNIDSKNDIAESEENLVPINPTLPMEKTETIEGNVKKTVWKNAVVNNKSKSDKSEVLENSMILDKSKGSEKSDFSESSESDNKITMASAVENKNVDVKRDFNLLWLLFLLVIPIGLIVKYRKKLYQNLFSWLLN